MPDANPLKRSFEQEIKSKQQLTDLYCTSAYRLLQNNNSYTLLVLWKERITSAIREHRNLVKSLHKLLSQLDEDTAALELLRQEIAIRIDHQEKTAKA